MLHPETKTLEYWRKKYLMEALIVVMVAMLLAVSFSFGISRNGFKVLFFWVVFVVSYLMIKELRADLQARGENLIFMKKNEFFSQLGFDFGRGIDEKTLLFAKPFGDYQIRECRNVMSGDKYVLEEDWFYKKVSTKIVPIMQTVFEGAVLEIDLSQTADNVSVSALKQAAMPLKNMLHAKNIQISRANDKIYFWFDGAQPLFYQFSLLKVNSLNAFIKRIDDLQETIHHLL